MNDSQPSVSVVIPGFNAASILPRAIESVRNQDYPNVIEIIVAAGDAETARVATDLGADVVSNPSTRTPDALNLGIARASGSGVVRCDAQSALPSGYVSRAVETMVRTGATNVGGMQVPVGTTYWERGIAAAMSSPLGAGDARYRTGGSEGPTETVYLGVFDKEQIEDLGGFDPEFARNQDYELNHRIIESGGIVWFDPTLQVEYRPRGSLKELWSQYYQYGRAKKRFARRHRGSLRWRQLAPPLLVICLLLSLVAALWFPWALTLPAGYAIGLTLGTFLTRGNAGTIPALGVMHISWGLGFLIAEPNRVVGA
jgi:glycosyltransferase involved in cell wall biosynthesis